MVTSNDRLTDRANIEQSAFSKVRKEKKGTDLQQGHDVFCKSSGCQCGNEYVLRGQMVVTQGRWKEGFPMDDVRRAQVSYGGHTTCTQVSFGHDAGRRASVPQGWQHPGHPSTSERNLASFPRISFPHSLLPSFFNFIPIIISPLILVLSRPPSFSTVLL